MRTLLLGLVFVTYLTPAQELEVISIETNDCILHGEIGEKYPITMYLKVAIASDNVGWIYSVNGWYKYDKFGTQIPLVGMWTGSNLYLFVSDDVKFKEDMRNMSYENENGQQYLGDFTFDWKSLTPSLREIEESFHLKFEEQSISGDWNNKDKSFRVSINNTNSQILKEADYLRLPNGELFDLLNVGIPGRASFEIEASANGGKNIILSYSYHANLNYNGRCGGADTIGKVGLLFDDSFQLLSFTHLELVNCYRDLSVESQGKLSNSQTKYTVMDYGASEKMIYQVDLEKAIVEQIDE